MRFSGLAGLVVVAALGLLSCTEKPTDPTSSAPPDTLVSFASDVQPLLSLHGCINCHGNSGQSNYSVRSYATILGPGNEARGRDMLEVRAGKPDSSYLVWKLEGNPPWPIGGVRMPQSGGYLDPSEIAVFRAWIRQGALDN